ncbi:MAG: metallophosphoesterase [Clostridiales bacterium]|nr:metallophosphoesterase [Clostridiales bacterium]
MKSVKRKITSFISVLLSLVMVLVIIPSGAFALDAQYDLNIAVLSDLHFYPKELTHDYCEDFIEFSKTAAKQYAQSEALLKTALAAVSKHAGTKGLEYVLIPGDLTKDSEYIGHKKLSEILKDFEKESGLEVFVIPGNHDVNNNSAQTFQTGELQATQRTKPEQFREFYKDLGYDHAYHTYTPSKGKGGGLTYSAVLGRYRLIAVDTCKYSADYTDKGTDFNETGGKISPELKKWILNEIADAERCGQKVIGMGHHNLCEHFGVEDDIFAPFMLDNWLETRETLADAGMHFWFSGHIHLGDIASCVSDNGETLYDICTASLTGYPNTFNEVFFSTDGDKVTAKVDTLDVDCEEQVTVNGVTYPSPYASTFSFGCTFGENGIAQFVEDLAAHKLKYLFQDIIRAGGIENYLQKNDISIEDMIDSLIKGGVSVGKVDIFTAKNVMGLVDYLLKQIDEIYINDLDHTCDVINNFVDKLLAVKVSDITCTKFKNTLGFSSSGPYGTLMDLAGTVLAYNYTPQYDPYDDAFLIDALDGFENGDNTDRLISVIIEAVLDDLVQNEILSKLRINFSSLFTKEITRKTIGAFFDFIFNILLRGNNTIKGFVDFVFKLGVLPYSSLNDVLYSVMGEYWTQSQTEGLGHSVCEIISGMVFDNDIYDIDQTLVYDGKVTVIPTASEYRLPSNIVQTFNSDPATGRNICWFTKYYVIGTDIELLPYSEAPQFTGVPTTGAGIKATAKQVNREYPGVDFGVIGVRNHTVRLNRHLIELTGLSPGTKYCFRVGDASKNWWSPVGVIETQDNSDTTAFIHITDPQSQNEGQYTGAWATLLKTAFEMFPESKFIASTGDNVDKGTNANQWQWYFNTASDTLLQKPIMTAAGNHEDENDVIPVNFPLTNIPKQSTYTGVYYSYDYNNIHFIVLNTNDLGSDKALSDAQINWLKEDAKASKAQWKIVMLHKALYSNSSHYDDKDVAAIRKQLGKLLPDLGIDVVLQGHDHTYLRTGVMDSNRVVRTKTKTISFNGREYTAKIEPKGTIYSIAGTGGVKFYPTKTNRQTDKLFPRAEVIADVKTPTFTAYHVSGGVLYYDAYTIVDGRAERIDSFAIIKDSKTATYTEAAAVNGTGGNSPDCFKREDLRATLAKWILIHIRDIIDQILARFRAQ